MTEESKNMDSSHGNEIKSPARKHSRRSKVSDVIERLYSLNGLHLISGSLQILLGLSTVFLALVGAIQPLWISTLITVLGSSATVVGIFFLYTVLHKQESKGGLLHKSIKRVIESQN